jgi:hypothetical protein
VDGLVAHSDSNSSRTFSTACSRFAG